MYNNRWKKAEPVKRPKRHKLLVVTKDDFKIVTFKRDKGVRLIHKDSGAREESREYQTQKKNREAAFSRLVLSDTFQTWLKAETRKRLEAQRSIHNRVSSDVEKEITPRYMRVEIRKDARWIDAPRD